MGRVGLLLLVVVLGLGGYTYQRPEVLQNVPWLAQKLGVATAATGDSAGAIQAPAQASTPAPHALSKCVGKNGEAVFSNMGCSQGQAEQAVTLSRTATIHLRGGAGSDPAAAAQAAGNGSTREPQKQSMESHLHDKFTPQ